MGTSKGHLSLLQDPAIYLACNGETFNIPPNEPPAYPVIPVSAMTAKHKELLATNSAAHKAWNTYKMVLTITRDQFVAAINEVYYAVLDNPTKELNAINLRSLIMHILTTYAQISQPDQNDNMAKFQTGIDLDLPLAIYTRKQESVRSLPPQLECPSSTKR
jgi:hypothetical protein